MRARDCGDAGETDRATGLAFRARRRARSWRKLPYARNVRCCVLRGAGIGEEVRAVPVASGSRGSIPWQTGRHCTL